MQKLTIDDLYTLEAYAKIRGDFRARVMEHKVHRQLPLGDHITLIFEDRLTMHYQIQEMLRVEKIFEPGGIDEELQTYNPLIPDGANWKATMLIEYPDPEERQQALQDLRSIEHQVFVQAGDLPAVTGIADEDMDRTSDKKTSAVHFLRFELDAKMIAALKSGSVLRAGITHPHYLAEVETPETLRESLIADLD
jgi:hypothetical protein